MGEPKYAYPPGYISMHTGDHDASGVLRPWIMTDLGWRPADGALYDRKTFPRLWDALPNRRRGDLVEVPNLASDGKPYGNVVHLTPSQMPPHSHHVAPSPYPPRPSHYAVDKMGRRIDPYFSGAVIDATEWKPPRPIGKVQKVHRDDRGLSIDMRLDADQYVDTISFLKRDMKRLLDAEISQAIIGPNQMRSALGLTPITDKENNMSGTVKLKTPTKNIKRKDLTAAVRLLGLSDLDDLLNAVAIIQELDEGQKIYRAYELQGEKIDNVNIKVVNRDIEGFLTDAKGTYIHDDVKLVVDGKMRTIRGSEFVVTSPAGEVGNDTLRMVSGN